MIEFTDKTMLKTSRLGSLRRKFFIFFKLRKYKKKVEYKQFLNSDEHVILTPPHLLALFELQSCFGYGNYFEPKASKGLKVDELQRLLEEDDFFYWD